MSPTWYLISMVVTATLVSLVLIFASWLARRIVDWLFMREYRKLNTNVMVMLKHDRAALDKSIAVLKEIQMKLKNLEQRQEDAP